MKKSEIEIDNVYFIEATCGKIIVNDAYEGVIIFDANLNLVKKIKIFDDIIIESVYLHEDKVVLYCYENECLVYINLTSYEIIIISLGEYKNIIFLPLYKWNENSLILSADNGGFFVNVDFSTKKIFELKKDNETVKDIYNYYFKLKKYKVYKYYPEKNLAIIQNENEIILYNYKNETKLKLDIELMDNPDLSIPSSLVYHEINLENEFIVEISERKAAVIYNHNKVYIYPDSSNYCLISGKIITENKCNFLFILSNDNSECEKSRITKYSF